MKYINSCILIVIACLGTISCDNGYNTVKTEVDLERALSVNAMEIVKETYIETNSLIPYGIYKEGTESENKAEILREQTVLLGKTLRELSKTRDWKKADRIVKKTLRENPDKEYQYQLTKHLSHTMLVNFLLDKKEDRKFTDAEKKAIHYYLGKLVDYGYPDINVVLAGLQKLDGFIDTNRIQELLSQAISGTQAFLEVNCPSCIENILNGYTQENKAEIETVEASNINSGSPGMVTQNIVNTLSTVIQDGYYNE